MASQVESSEGHDCQACPLTLVTEHSATFSSDAGFFVDDPPYTYVFTCNFAKMTAGHEMGELPEEELFLLQGLEYFEGFRLGTRQTLVPWRLWAQGLPDEGRAAPAQPRRDEGDRLRDELIREWPWLATSLDKRAGYAAPSPAEAAAPSEAPADPEVVEESMVDALRQLDDARAVIEEAVAAAPPLRGWRVQVLGGRYTQWVVGVPFAAVQGMARGGDALGFCNRRQLQRSMRLSTSDFGLPLAHLLARAYVHRMEFAFGLEQDGVVGPLEAVTHDHWRLYEEPEELRAVLAENPLRLLHKRVADLRRLCAPP